MKTLYLKTTENTNYYITSLNETQKILIEDSHKNQDFEVANNILKINCNNIKLIGETTRINKDLRIGAKITPYLDSFTATTAGRKQLHYRDYTKTKAEQKDRAWLINICSDNNSSWNTIMMILGKPNYCVIWGDLKENIYEEVIGQS